MSTAPEPLDLDAIRDKWLTLCPSCDAGLPYGCTHPEEDYRPVMLALTNEIERLHTWAGLMSVVDEHYPISVFPVTEDRAEADDGVRILSLVRHLDRRRTELRDAQNDLLDVRGLLSPNGGDPVLPAGFDISEQVAPAVEWLINEVWRLRVVGEAAAAIVSFLRERGWTPANEWFMPETVPFVAAVEARQAGS